MFGAFKNKIEVGRFCCIIKTPAPLGSEGNTISYCAFWELGWGEGTPGQWVQMVLAGSPSLYSSAKNGVCEFPLLPQPLPPQLSRACLRIFPLPEDVMWCLPFLAREESLLVVKMAQLYSKSLGIHTPVSGGKCGIAVTSVPKTFPFLPLSSPFLVCQILDLCNRFLLSSLS